MITAGKTHVTSLSDVEVCVSIQKGYIYRCPFSGFFRLTYLSLGMLPSTMEGVNQIYQYSIISSLAQGICADGLPVFQALRYGDHGLGTLAGLDGEVIIIDGQAFQYTSTGGVRALEESDITAFLMVTFFEPSKAVTLPYLTHETLMREMSSLYPSTANHFFAIRVDAVFPHITYRVAPRQNHHRETLAEVVHRQSVRSFKEQQGTIFGFYSPAFTEAFSVVGLHLHFMSEDRKAGGHVLGFQARDVSLSGAVITKYHVELPETEDFNSEVIVEPDKGMIRSAEGLDQ
jgi:acetolactate decarboxylase